MRESELSEPVLAKEAETRVCVCVCFYLSSQEYKDSHTVRQESWFYVAKL